MSWLENIKRCIKWLPIIWKDRDWDHAFFFDLLERKLRSMQHFFESRNTHVISALETSQQIKGVADALQRMREDYYCEESREDCCDRGRINGFWNSSN